MYVLVCLMCLEGDLTRYSRKFKYSDKKRKTIQRIKGPLKLVFKHRKIDDIYHFFFPIQKGNSNYPHAPKWLFTAEKKNRQKNITRKGLVTGIQIINKSTHRFLLVKIKLIYCRKTRCSFILRTWTAIYVLFFGAVGDSKNVNRRFVFLFFSSKLCSLYFANCAPS